MAANESSYSAASPAGGIPNPGAPHHDQQQHWGIGNEGVSSSGVSTGVLPSETKPVGGEGADASVADGLTSGILMCRKRKAPEELPQVDEANAERLKRATDTLTKEQMRNLLIRACAHYPAVENALYSMIEADPSSRRLMIRNVPYSTTEQSLRTAIEAHGEIEDFKLVVDRMTGVSKGFAFVTYKSLEDVAKVLQTEVTVDGRPLSIKLASQQPDQQAMKRPFIGPNQGCRLFVRNVPDTCDERRLKQEFETFGSVREAAIVRNRDGTSKGYGFVVYEDPEALMKAASQGQRVIDGQVTFVSVASESRKQQQTGGGGILPPQHLQQLPLGGANPYQQQLQQQQMQQQMIQQQSAAQCQWPMGGATASAGRADVSSPYGNQAAAAAAMPAVSGASAVNNPYMQQITAALMPQLYMHHYQQHYLAGTQASAAAAAASMGTQQQQQKHSNPYQQYQQQ